MGVTRIDTEKIMENVSVLKQTMQANSATHTAVPSLNYNSNNQNFHLHHLQQQQQQQHLLHHQQQHHQNQTFALNSREPVDTIVLDQNPQALLKPTRKNANVNILIELNNEKEKVFKIKI
jgi:hypothetical protein